MFPRAKKGRLSRLSILRQLVEANKIKLLAKAAQAKTAGKLPLILLPSEPLYTHPIIRHFYSIWLPGLQGHRTFRNPQRKQIITQSLCLRDQLSSLTPHTQFYNLQEHWSHLAKGSLRVSVNFLIVNKLLPIPFHLRALGRGTACILQIWPQTLSFTAKNAKIFVVDCQ